MPSSHSTIRHISFPRRLNTNLRSTAHGAFLDLSNKTAVVIGGTSGINLELIRGLARAGADVVPTGRREDRVRSAAADVVTLGRRSFAQTCDDTDSASIERLLYSDCAKFGAVQILVSCAGPNATLLDGTERSHEFLLRAPMHRFGQLEEPAGAAIFPASDAASYVTGHLLVVDGRMLVSGVNQ